LLSNKDRIVSVLVWLFLLVTAPGMTGAAGSKASNENFTLEVFEDGSEVIVRFYDKQANLYRCDGPYIYRAIRTHENGEEAYSRLEGVKIQSQGDRIHVTGRLAGLKYEQTFRLPQDKPYMEEQIQITNQTGSTISFREFESRMQIKVAEAGGKVLDSLARDRFMALPFLHRISDPKGFRHDYDINYLLTHPGFSFSVESWPKTRIPSEHYLADSWIWKRDQNLFGIFSFNQDNMLLSMLTPVKREDACYLKFGGVFKDNLSLSALERIESGAVMNLGLIRYQHISGDYNDGAYAYRAMLDEKGCRFPADYNPLVHWNQLYNMVDAWNNRIKDYTLERIHKEAEKACEYSCEALYLDPGWDTTFGSFLWGSDWLGNRKDFMEHIRKEYGLRVSLHCPVAPWSSDLGLIMGPSSLDEWPASTHRMVDRRGDVPLVKDRRRNLALVAGVTVFVSGTIPGYPQHKPENIIDNHYNNNYSWVANAPQAWVQVDLGKIYEIGAVCLSNDVRGEYNDRQPSDYGVLVSEKSDQPGDFKEIVRIENQPLQGMRELTFEPVKARFVKVEIRKTSADQEPRLDEVEIYESQQDDWEDLEAAPLLADADSGSRMCMGSISYRKEAERRLWANCADGAVFLMFDGTWYRDCKSAEHGHPQPYTYEDHIDSCVDMARRVHKQFPKVLIEMHDMLIGWNKMRVTPVYYKYGLKGSYDDNWAFELMWEPMKNIQEEWSLGLYYYNLASNVPLYLHIKLDDDNEHALSLWWYASTIRHLGIGGDHKDGKVRDVHKAAMKKYRQLESFFKRGDFYGINEEIHLHVLPDQQAVVVNIFNLFDQPRSISGQVEVGKMGLDPARSYQTDKPGCRMEAGIMKVNQELPAWGTEVAVLRSE